MFFATGGKKPIDAQLREFDYFSRIEYAKVWNISREGPPSARLFERGETLPDPSILSGSFDIFTFDVSVLADIANLVFHHLVGNTNLKDFSPSFLRQIDQRRRDSIWPLLPYDEENPSLFIRRMRLRDQRQQPDGSLRGAFMIAGDMLFCPPQPHEVGEDIHRLMPHTDERITAEKRFSYSTLPDFMG